MISLKNPNSDWTIPHNSAISRGIYEQRKDEIENGFLLSFTDSGVNIANLKSVPIEIFAEILNVFMIVRNIRQNSDVFYIYIQNRDEHI